MLVEVVHKNDLSCCRHLLKWLDGFCAILCANSRAKWIEKTAVILAGNCIPGYQ